MKNILVILLFLFALDTSIPNTYLSPYGFSKTHNITVNAGTHLFIVAGIDSNKFTEWYVNNFYKKTDNSGVLHIEPGIAYNFTKTDTTIIKAIVYNDNWSVKEIHTWNVISSAATSIDENYGVPKYFELSQNYPNPFNPSARIEYNIPADAKVKLEVFAVTGEKIVELMNGMQSAGYYSVEVNSSMLKSAASGVYIYRMNAVEKLTGKNFVSAKKMMLLK